MLIDRLCLKYYELPKLPDIESVDDELRLWLTLFNAKTEDLKRLEDMEVPIMKQAIGAYRTVTATDEFRQLERMRADARNREASALGHARREGIAIGEEAEREKWQGVVAENEVTIAEQAAENEQLRAQIAALQAQLAKDS